MPSLAVKEWRKHTKERIVESLGGRCNLCGYNKCLDALEVHHLDPTKKNFSFGAIRSNPKSWPNLVDELRKCVLLCANCHREFHAGIIVIPQTALRFDENFADYKEKQKAKYYDACPICGQQKYKGNKTCSLQCAAKRAYTVNWDAIDLNELKKTKTNCQIADSLGISESAVRKRLKKIWLEEQDSNLHLSH